MDADNSPSQGPAHRQTQPGSPSRPIPPAGRRPALDGFSARRPGTPQGNTAHFARPGGTQITVQSAQSSEPQQVHHAFRHHSDSAPQPVVTRPVPTHAAPAQHNVGRSSVPADNPDTMPSSKAKHPKEHGQTGHAGLVGLVAFILLGALFLAPVLPGKIMQNFPLSSQTFSTGDQALDCIGTQGTVNSSTSYNSKAGSPLNYTYSTTSTQSATCNGASQSAVTGHSSQFSPLAMVIDLLLSLVLAVAIAKVWRLVFGGKPHKR